MVTRKLLQVLPTADASIARFNALCQKLYWPALSKIGLTPKSTDAHSETLLRTILLRLLANAKHPNVIPHLQALFADKDKNPIPADLRGAVYVRNGGETGFNQLVELLVSEDAVERSVVLRSLGTTPDVKLVDKLIALLLSDKVRNQDCIYPFIALASNTKAGDALLHNLTSRWNEVSKKMPTMMLSSVIGSLGALGQSKYIAAVEEFWKTLSPESRQPIERSYQQALEGIKLQSAWVARDAQSAADYLETVNVA